MMEKEIKKFEGFFAIKLYANGPGTLTLLLSTKANDFSDVSSVHFRQVLSFSDFGLIGQQVLTIDVNSLGLANRYLAEQAGLNPDDLSQFFFAADSVLAKRELIIACKSYSIE
ncbi:MAG: hypothetical protein U0T75_10985 [Chitinophagales bacterium]